MVLPVAPGAQAVAAPRPVGGSIHPGRRLWKSCIPHWISPPITDYMSFIYLDDTPFAAPGQWLFLRRIKSSAGEAGPQLLLGHLAQGLAAGQASHHFQLLWQFLLDQTLSPEKVAELAQVRRRAPGHHHRTDPLAAAGIGQADHRRL